MSKCRRMKHNEIITGNLNIFPPWRSWYILEILIYVYSSINTRRGEQYLWPYQPPISMLLSKSWLPWVSKSLSHLTSAGSALAFTHIPIPTDTFILEAALVAFWTFDPSAFWLLHRFGWQSMVTSPPRGTQITRFGQFSQCEHFDPWGGNRVAQAAPHRTGPRDS